MLQNLIADFEFYVVLYQRSSLNFKLILSIQNNNNAIKEEKKNEKNTDRKIWVFPSRFQDNILPLPWELRTLRIKMKMSERLNPHEFDLISKAIIYYPLLLPFVAWVYQNSMYVQCPASTTNTIFCTGFK